MTQQETLQKIARILYSFQVGPPIQKDASISFPLMIWLNHFMDDRHFKCITKLSEKNLCIKVPNSDR